MIIKKLKKKEGAGLCALFFLCVLCDLSFTAPTDLFQSANKLYEQGKYKDAITEYHKIIDRGYQSGPLYYNLGNCYFKLGSLGKTILYYEKARRIIPNDPELRFNLNYVDSLLEDRITVPKKIFNIINLLTFGKWLGFIIIIWLILITSIIIRPHKYIIIGLSILLLIGITSTVIQYISLSSPTAVILAKEVPVRYGPGEAEVEAFLLHEGTKVEIKNSEENWYQIQLPDGKSGWLPKDTVECI